MRHDKASGGARVVQPNRLQMGLEEHNFLEDVLVTGSWLFGAPAGCQGITPIA